MKKLNYIYCLFLLQGCVFTFDPALPRLYIHNNSDENILVYERCGNVDFLPPISGYTILRYRGDSDSVISFRDVDSVPRFSGLHLFTWVDANTVAYGTVGGTRKKPRLSCNEKEITLFFITENTILNYDWDEIHKRQMFVKKITLTEQELHDANWTYIYPWTS